MSRPKIRNARAAAVLLELGDKLDRLPFGAATNEVARRALAASLPALLQLFLRAKSGARDLRVVLRHSVTQPGRFHLLRSDIDTALIFSEVLPSRKGLERCLGAYSQARAAIPWLGEAEIYSEPEWRLRARLDATFAPLLELTWSLRKWTWQEQALLDAKTPFHRAKAERAIAAIREKLGFTDSADWSSIVGKRLDAVGVLPPARELGRAARWKPDNYSGFLSWRILPSSQESLSRGKTIPLDPELAVAFAAVLPDGPNYVPGLEADVARLREEKSVRKALAANCAKELLLSATHIRTRSSGTPIPPDDDGWARYLKDLIATYDPALVLD